MAKEPKKLDDLFHDTLKDIYFAEKKILSALPKMAKAAQAQDLKAAFEKHANAARRERGQPTRTGGLRAFPIAGRTRCRRGSSR